MNRWSKRVHHALAQGWNKKPVVCDPILQQSRALTCSLGTDSLILRHMGLAPTITNFSHGHVDKCSTLDKIRNVPPSEAASFPVNTSCAISKARGKLEKTDRKTARRPGSPSEHMCVVSGPSLAHTDGDADSSWMAGPAFTNRGDSKGSAQVPGERWRSSMICLQHLS